MVRIQRLYEAVTDIVRTMSLVCAALPQLSPAEAVQMLERIEREAEQAAVLLQDVEQLQS